MMNGATVRQFTALADSPDAGTLRDETAQYDQKCVLSRRNDVQPDT